MEKFGIFELLDTLSALTAAGNAARGESQTPDAEAQSAPQNAPPSAPPAARAAAPAEQQTDARERRVRRLPRPPRRDAPPRGKAQIKPLSAPLDFSFRSGYNARKEESL